MSKSLTGLLVTIASVAGVAAYLALAADPPATKKPDGAPVNRPELWKKYDEAIKKGLPKTAIEHLNPIYESALRDKAYPEAVKALGKKIALEGNIQGNKPEEKITRLQAEIEKAPKEAVPILDAILANWYWHYFQHNRWRFMQRTQTGESPGDDITTWDLRRIFAEIDKFYTRALAAEDLLKKTPIGDYDALLEKGALSDTHRPTLYDFIAHEALVFYASGEQGLSKAEDHFELEATSPIFASAKEFLAWEIKTTDTESRTIKAIKIYQSLLRFHEADADQTAFLDADVHRLRFGHIKAFGEEKNENYKKALKEFATKHEKHELSAFARQLWAGVLRQENELVEARQIALVGAKAFPKSPGGILCGNLVREIEHKTVQTQVERVWNDPLPKIRLEYKNLTKVHFRLVREDWKGRLDRRNWRPENLDQNDHKTLLAKKAEVEWSADLPATDDYRVRTEEVTIPKNLKPGFFFLIASHDADFRANADNQISVADVWVSKLALVSRNQQGASIAEGFVLDALTGEPIADAKVELFLRTQNGTHTAGPVTKTDKNGMYSVDITAQNGIQVLATFGDQQISTMFDAYLYRGNRPPDQNTQTIFFTDRSLYRPGQTVQYKGIVISANRDSDDYKTLADQTITVIFNDPNGKEIAKQQHRSNEYGSFSGSFTAPRDRLAGRMHLTIQGPHHGHAWFNVEEYKRPKFQVTLDAPKTPGKLNEEVSLQGKATAYTGAAINGGQIRYRVVRQVQYPHWWYWCFWWRQPRQESQEIAHGTAMTENDGTFTIKFVAKPDLKVSEKDEPTFVFAVSADVVDTTGETRSASKSVNVAYTALKANLTAGEWQSAAKPVEITVSTTTHDGEGQIAKGNVKIYALKQPAQVQRPEITGGYRHYRAHVEKEPKPDPANPNSWELGDLAAEQDFNTDGNGKATVAPKLKAGIYRAMLETKDRFGKAVTARLPIQVIDPDAKAFNIKLPHLLASPAWSLEPGKEFQAVWGSGYDKARAFVEVEHRGKMIQRYWTDANVTQQQVKQAIDESMRGGFTLHVTMVRENRAYLTSRHIDVPWTNKSLSLKWEHFVSKLEPARKETWTLTVSGPDAKKAVAEMVATLYDKSLDAYLPHNYPGGFGVFRYDHSQRRAMFENQLKHFQYFAGGFHLLTEHPNISYRHLPHEITANLWGYQYFGRNRSMPAAPTAGFAQAGEEQFALRDANRDEVNGAPMEKAAAKRAAGNDKGEARKENADGAGNGPGNNKGPDLENVSARKNLSETAFFFPHLLSDNDGKVKLEFVMPEALTTWKFMGFSHDKTLRAGLLTGETITAKDLMIQPNAPRFVREGDTIEFTVKVSNQSAARQQGSVRLSLADARTGKSVDQFLGNATLDQSFDIPAQESRSFAWRLSVPDGMGPLTYKAVGATDRLSDGEEGFLPVLSRYIMVTESLPLPIRGKQTKDFEFLKLRNSANSNTIKHQALTVQMVSNPSWYAVMALPYLMEYPYECSEQTFNRLYANALARHIAKSDPRIRQIFDQWKGTPALDSPLEKNQDLKAVMLEETPWLRQANKESEARRNVGILFDDNRLNSETARLIQRLAQMQIEDGAWPWFPGGPANDYITLYITTGFGRMRHLGVDLDTTSAVKSLTRLDLWIDRIYRDILRHGHKDKNNLSPTIALYLYGRSFFLKDKAIDPKAKEAVEYFLSQSREHWLKLANRQSQAHLAIALKRFGDKQTPLEILASIKERSVSEEEMGMFWRETELSWWWYRAPIETQAMMVEAFDEVLGDAKAVEDCKVWLLKQKQTQDWKTTKATADAVYALLLRGDNLLRSDALVEVSLGGQKVEPQKVEAGTGFYEHKFIRGEITSQQSQITVKKTDAGVSWGSVHWQYLEDISKVTPHDATPLKLTKTLWTKEYTKSGPVLQPIRGQVKVGDEVIVRVTLKTDRDMEYVHLKDHRGSGTEPVNVLSRYKFQDGLAYYESTKDTASHFFIDYLPKGTYVFEYAVRVQLKGQYQTGSAHIQCMYAPEFNSHSESLPLDVK